jgi:two-component system, OmpR family, response regulator
VSESLSVLLIEDDARIANLTREYLEQHGLRVTHFSDGALGQAEALRHPYDVVLLDLMLPGRSGFEICKAIRERSDVPIIVLTARTEEIDRVLGLELGADDYVTKPFSARELLARITALMRRARGKVGPARGKLQVGPLTLEQASRKVTRAGQEIQLTSYEFALLQALMERAGRVLSREQLMDLAKGSPEESFDRSIDVHISRLRQKLGDDPRKPELIKTVRGAGYLLATDDA